MIVENEQGDSHGNSDGDAKSGVESFASYQLKMDKYNVVTEKKIRELEEEVAPKPAKKLSPKIKETQTTSAFANPPLIITPEVTPPKPQRPAPLNHRQQRAIAKGKKPINAKLDLHQLSRNEAHNKVTEFITRCFGEKKRFLLIITGKGQGILQNELKNWLENPLFHDKILFHTFAEPRHGGEGARYVYLKKNRTEYDETQDDD